MVVGSIENVGVCLVGFYEDVESFCDIVEIECFGFYLLVMWEVLVDIMVMYEFEYIE